MKPAMELETSNIYQKYISSNNSFKQYNTPLFRNVVHTTVNCKRSDTKDEKKKTRISKSRPLVTYLNVPSICENNRNESQAN